MSDRAKIALNLRRWRIAVATHDVENPTHTSWGIGLSHFDMERLDLDEGETLWQGIIATADGAPSANFRVMCDGEHDDCKPKTLEEKTKRENADAEHEKAEEEVEEFVRTRAVGVEA